MARDPKARRYPVSYTGGTFTASLGLLECLFGPQVLKWNPGSTGTTPLGRKRYKYGGKQKAAGAAGKEIFLDLGEAGIYSGRVTGDVVDFLNYVVPKAGEKILAIWTKRGTEYGRTVEDVPVVP